MRIFHSRLLRNFIITLSLLILFSACQRPTERILRSNMTISARLQPLLEDTKTVCFGRFLVEVPSSATVVYGPTEVATPIEYLPKESENLSRYINARLGEVEKERRFLLKNDIPRLPLFGKVIDGEKAGQKIIFGSKDQVGYSVYSFIPVKEDLFIQHINSIPPDEDIVGIFNEIAKNLHSRLADEVPAMPGICIDGGFIPLEQEYERATIGIRLKEFPDVHFSIDAHKNLQYLPKGSSPKLLREQAKEFAEADGLGAVFAQTKILRQKDRQVNGWDGEELALRTPAYKDDKSVHDFRFHSMGGINDRLHPELDVRFDSGLKGNDKARVEPSLTDDEALALWDKIINTIRIRQPSDAKSAKPEASKVPLSSTVSTGQSCPQSGWWECYSNEKIQGSKRRFFKSGETMPLILLGEPGLWQKLTGAPSVRQATTVWKLVQYEDKTEQSSSAT